MPDYNLKAALQRIKTSPSHFAIIKGKKSNQVFVAPQPPNAKQLAPVMAECGEGKPVATGICMWENDKLVFATKSEPAGALEALISNAFKTQQCASFLPVVLRAMGEKESESTEGETEAGGEGKSQEPSTGSPPSKDEAETKRLMEAIGKLTPIIKQAVADHPSRKAEILQPVLAFQKHMKAKELTEAKNALLQVGTLLKGLKNGNGTTMTNGASKGGISIVALGKARIEWNKVRQNGVQEIQRLKTILLREYQQDAEEKSALQKAIQRLDGVMAEFDEKLGDRLDSVLNAEPTERPKLAAEAKATLDQLSKYILSDRILKLIDGNEFAPDMAVQAPMKAQLAEIGAALG